MRRNDKTRHEWRKAYKEKEELNMIDEVERILLN